MSSKTREFFEQLKSGGEMPSLSSELKAMAREAIKDIRSTAMETFLGSPEQSTEPGVPLNPTMQEVTQDRDIVKGDYQPDKDTFEKEQERGGREM